MKIIIAKNIGFCSGVKRAVKIAEKSLKEKESVQFLGELVHNEEVLKKFKDLGVKFIKDPKKAKPGIVIIQAHGFPPIKEKLNRKIILKDATCPLVKKAQRIAEDLEKKDFQVVIIGDKNHSETKGIKGYAKKALIIENEKEAEKIKSFKKIGVVVQTTQSPEKVKKVLEKLKSKTKIIKFYNTVCPETKNRQKEAKIISKITDAVLVIGSKKSANTKRLFEIVGRKAQLLNTLKELKIRNLKKIKRLGIISGASTPDWEIKKIIKCLQK